MSQEMEQLEICLDNLSYTVPLPAGLGYVQKERPLGQVSSKIAHPLSQMLTSGTGVCEGRSSVDRPINIIIFGPGPAERELFLPAQIPYHLIYPYPYSDIESEHVKQKYLVGVHLFDICDPPGWFDTEALSLMQRRPHITNIEYHPHFDLADSRMVDAYFRTFRSKNGIADIISLQGVLDYLKPDQIYRLMLAVIELNPSRLFIRLVGNTNLISETCTPIVQFQIENMIKQKLHLPLGVDNNANPYELLMNNAIIPQISEEGLAKFGLDSNYPGIHLAPKSVLDFFNYFSYRLDRSCLWFLRSRCVGITLSLLNYYQNRYIL